MNVPKCMNLPGGKAKIAFAIQMLYLLAILFVSTQLQAQSFYGSIVGTVTDASGAVVPGATVTATNIGTNDAQKTQSDAGGKYSFVNLVPADYKITVEKTSFKRFENPGVSVAVGATARVDSALAVGDVSQTVEVTTQAALLQTESGTQGQEIEGAEVQEMPLNGRNVLNLIALAPGVVPSGGAMGDPGLNQGTRTAGGIGWGNYAIGGATQGQGGQYLDGVPNNLLGGNVVALVPTQDAVQELNVATSVPGADFGRYSGGVVNMTTKSGSNAFHGTAYEYFRNAVFNANTYFNNLTGTPRAQWNQNQYGAALTGPIVKDKLFFMFTWEGFRALTGNASNDEVPTLALQNGVFSGQTLPADPLGICSIQPYTGQTVNGQTFASGGTYIANLYGPGLLPGTTCGDPTNEVLKQFYPLPNSNLAASNFFFQGSLKNNQDQFNGRVDYTLSAKQRLFARYTYWDSHDSNQVVFNDVGYKNGTGGNGTTWPTNNGASSFFTTQGVVGDTYSANPTTVLDVRLNYVRQYYPNAAQGTNVNEAQFGTAFGSLASQMAIHELPGYNFNTGVHSLTGMYNYLSDSTTWYNTYGIGANLTKILGPHTLKFGTELRLMDESQINPAGGAGDASGKFTYNNSGWLGDEWANFLLGYSTQAQFEETSRVAAYSYYQAYYVTDTWQAARNLTLNLGLRYEVPGTIAERNNKQTVLLPNAVDPYTGVTGTLSLVASPLYSGRGATQPKYDLFAPRVGFAYRAGANTALRGGYGISYLPNDLETQMFPSGSYVNSATTTVNTATNVSPQPLQGILTGFVGTGLNQPSGRSNPAFMQTAKLASLTTYYGQNIGSPVPFQNYPMTQQWNVSLSHQFKGNMMAEVAYTGLKGSNMPGLTGAGGSNGYGLDQIPDGSYTTSGTVASGPLAGQSLNTKAGFKCPNTPNFATGAISVGQCIRPNPYYNNVLDTAEYIAVQNYRSFVVRGEKRMGSNGVLNANYTWSKDTGNNGSLTSYLGAGGQFQDFDNPGGEISLLDIDVTNRVIVSYVQHLPFGKGQKYGNNYGNVMNALASGWAVSGITTFQSGTPLIFTTATGSQLTALGAGTERPLIVPGCNKKIGGSGLSRVKAGAWYNTSCFENVGATTTINGAAVANPYLPAGWAAGYLFGNEPRNDDTLRNDGVKNFDFSFEKSTPIWEKASFEFRAEAYNVFNRVQFGGPNNSVGGATYGKISSQTNKPRQLQLSARINF